MAASYQVGQGLSMQVNRPIVQDQRSKLGWQMGVNFRPDAVGISPALMYQANDEITLTTSVGMDTQGALSNRVAAPLNWAAKCGRGAAGVHALYR